MSGLSHHASPLEATSEPELQGTEDATAVEALAQSPAPLPGPGHAPAHSTDQWLTSQGFPSGFCFLGTCTGDAVFSGEAFVLCPFGLRRYCSLVISHDSVGP